MGKGKDKLLTAAELENLYTSTELYDTSPDMKEGFTLNLNPGLTDEEIEEAIKLAPFSRGVMVVSGPPRSGKGLFTTTFLWKIKRYYQNRRILLDYRPRRLFGEYTPFGEQTLMEQVDQLKQASGAGIQKHKDALKNATDDWMTKTGQVVLKNGAMGLDEFWRYCKKRRTGSNMNYLMTGLVKIWGHLDLLIVGMCPSIHELDQQEIVPYLTAEVRTTWCASIPNTTKARLYPLRRIGSNGVVDVAGKPIDIYVDGGKPRAALGGKRYFDLYNSKDPKSIGPVKINFGKV